MVERGFTLLNPGPCNTSSGVKAAALHHEVCHRTAAFGHDLDRLIGKLVRVFSPSQSSADTPHDVLLLTGSGTAAMEASLTTFTAAASPVLVLDNGVFGARLATILQRHGQPIVHIRYPAGERVRAADVEAALAAHPTIDVVAMVHHETSVGLLNPVAEVGAICRRRGRLLLVDAVSSLGAEDLDLVRDQVDVCWASANKCLHGAAGVAFVAVSPRTWARTEAYAPRSLYLDLRLYKRHLDDRAQTPFTPAIGLFYALEAAVDEFLDEGHAARRATYAARNRKLRAAFRKLGLEPFTRSGHESHSVVIARLPPRRTFLALDRAMQRRGFIIYDTKPPLQGAYFQVANMGHLADGALDRFIRCLAAAL